MTRRTLGDVRTDLARIAGAVGMQASDPRVLDYLNLAIEELMNEGDFPSLVDPYVFRTYDGTITLPSGYERILHCKLSCAPLQMQSSWYEYVTTGYLTNVETPDLQGVLDRDNVVLYKDIPSDAAYTLRLETVVDEREGATLPDSVIVQGLDADGQAIRSGSGNVYIDGVTFNWVNGSGNLQTAESTQVFTSVSAAIKSETKMPIKVYAVPVLGGTDIQVGQWGPRETRPSYRRYKINGLDATVANVVYARLRKSFVRLENDNDILPISNMPALRAMILGLWYFETGKDELYATKKAIAIDILNKEASKYRGETRKKPLVTMSEGSSDNRGYYVS